MWWHLFAARRTQRWSGETESVNKKHVADRGLGSSYLPLNWGPRCWSGRTKQWQGLFPAILIECPTDQSDKGRPRCGVRGDCRQWRVRRVERQRALGSRISQRAHQD